MLAPEARPGFDFDSLWAAFWRCCEYCGTRAALRTVVEHMGKEAQFEVFQALEDETAGSWSFELENDTEERDAYKEAVEDEAAAAGRLIAASRALLQIVGGK